MGKGDPGRVTDVQALSQVSRRALERPWNVSRAGAQRDAPLRTTHISRSLKDPTRAWEGLNVAPAPSLRILQVRGGDQVKAYKNSPIVSFGQI